MESWDTLNPLAFKLVQTACVCNGRVASAKKPPLCTVFSCLNIHYELERIHMAECIFMNAQIVSDGEELNLHNFIPSTSLRFSTKISHQEGEVVQLQNNQVLQVWPCLWELERRKIHVELISSQPGLLFMARRVSWGRSLSDLAAVRRFLCQPQQPTTPLAVDI